MMEFSWETVVAALESPQGSTFYALLALLLLSAASLLLQNEAKPAGLARPISYTLAVLMGLRLVEAIAFAFAWSGSAVATQAMAPVERGLHLITLLALAWLWTQPAAEERRAAPIFAIALLAALLLTWVLFAPWLSSPAGAPFNYTDADYAWSAACIVALLFGMLRAVKARQLTGLIVFGILLLGQSAHLFLAEPFGSMPLATQAAHLLVLPLLFVLPVTRPIKITIADKKAEEQPIPPIGSETQPAAQQTVPAFYNFDQVDEDYLDQLDEDPSSKFPTEDSPRDEAEEPEADLLPYGSRLGQEPSTDLQAQLAQLEAENQAYRQDVDQLLAHIDELESAPGAGLGLPSNEIVQGLQLENERLVSAVAGFERGAPQPSQAPEAEETRQAREELRLALEEVARLHEDLEAAQRSPVVEVAHLHDDLDAAQRSTPAVVQPEQKGLPITARQVEVIASIAQELRQPLSSVMGYSDLLLGESVGILGALQRKFLERVRSSTERMNTLIDNLIRISELDEAGYSATRKPVDLGAVIDDAIGLLRNQFQEKQLVMRVDLPEQLPELNTDRDALQQILYYLLLNADAATPAGGQLTLRAVIDHQQELGDFVLIQVSDTGGGIPEEDLPRVFSRVYRARNPVVSGVGDTGVGLSIAETLTQALGGRIWVESEAGVGATLSVLLPLSVS